MRIEDVKIGMRVKYEHDGEVDYGVVKEVCWRPVSYYDEVWCDWESDGAHLLASPEHISPAEESTPKFKVGDKMKRNSAQDTGSAATSSHYNSKLIQPIEIVQMVLTKEEFCGAMKFNIIKYSQRAGSKEGESSDKDWKKALQYKMWLDLAEQGVRINPREHVV